MESGKIDEIGGKLLWIIIVIVAIVWTYRNLI